MVPRSIKNFRTWW